MTYVTWDIDIRQELHLDFELALTLARLAAAPLYIKGKPSRAVAAHLALRKTGEQLANQSEQVGVSSRVGTRGTPDGTLIDVDDFINLFYAFDPIMGTGFVARTVQQLRQALIQHLDE